MHLLSHPASSVITCLFLILLAGERTVCDETHVEFDCLTQEPIGYEEDQLENISTCPAYIQVSTSTYTTGQAVTVSLISQYKIKSYIIQARSDIPDASNPRRGPYGQWSDESRPTQRCVWSADTVIFFSPSRPVTRVQLTWRSLPPLPPPEIYFRATIVAADGKIWTNLRSFVIRKAYITPGFPSTSRGASTETTPRLSTEKTLIGGSEDMPDSDPNRSNSSSSNTDKSSRVNSIKEAIMEEKIIEFQQMQQQKLLEDDWGNEGIWSMEREQRRVKQKSAMDQTILFAEKARVSEQQSQNDILRYEMSDTNRIVNYSKKRVASRR